MRDGRTHRTSWSIARWAAIAVAITGLGANGKRSITETDLYAFQWIGSPQIAPDGSKVVYALVKVSSKHDDYETALWMVPASGGAPRQLTAGPRDSGARWSPDGKMLAFLRATEKAGKPEPPQIYLLSMDGGEPRPLTEIPKGAGNPVWSPDGRFLAFASTTLAKDFDKKKDDAPPESDVRVITKATYRDNDKGYLESGRSSHIWVVEVPKILAGPQKAKPVTTGEFSESDITWSRDSASLYFTSNRVQEPYYQPPDSDIYIVSATGGEIRKVTSIDGPIASLSLSPDGQRLAFVGSINRGEGMAQRSYSQPDLFFVSVEPGSTPKNLTAAYDFDIDGAVGGDQAPPRGGGASRPYWSPDGRSVFVKAAEEGRVNLKRIDVETGKVDALTKGDHAVLSSSATPDGSQLAVLLSTPTRVGDVFLVNGRSGEMSQVTRINDDLFTTLNLTEPEMFWYKSFDGRRIQTWVQRPPDFEAGKKYP